MSFVPLLFQWGWDILCISEGQLDLFTWMNGHDRNDGNIFAHTERDRDMGLFRIRWFNKMLGKHINQDTC